MELIFNELSLPGNPENRFKGRNLMEKLLLTCKKAKEHNFDHLRLERDFLNYYIAENYQILNWLTDNLVGKTYKDLLLSLRIHPFIAEEDKTIENNYIANYYYLNAPQVKKLHKKKTAGLAAAFLYKTLSISFKTDDIWDNEFIELIENKEKIVSVNHISRPEHLKAHHQWIQSKKPVELLESDILPAKKIINIRDDHGKDILTEFAKKLVKSPYVIKIINSLPFNPQEKNFIKKVHSDGKAEFVLNRTDKGYGLVVQTTGRDLRETEAIAKIINKKITKRQI